MSSTRLPAGSRFKGYRDFVVQDLVITSRNTRYRLERWITPQGETLYGDLKAFKNNPLESDKAGLAQRFDEIFTHKTGFQTLNQLLKRIHGNKGELLRVLERPEIALHTNGSETDIRDYVKKRKVSGGTRSDEGQRCRDTFISLKKTCRKLGISFRDFLYDRLCTPEPCIPQMSDLVRERATAPIY